MPIVILESVKRGSTSKRDGSISKILSFFLSKALLIEAKLHCLDSIGNLSKFNLKNFSVILRPREGFFAVKSQFKEKKP